MTKEQISVFAKKITFVNHVTVITFSDKTQWFGYFETDTENIADQENNFWSFVKFIDKSKKHHFNGNDVINIEIINNPHVHS